MSLEHIADIIKGVIEGGQDVGAVLVNDGVQPVGRIVAITGGNSGGQLELSHLP